MVAVNEASKTVISQNKGVVRAIQDTFNKENSDIIEELCVISTHRLPIMILTYTDRSDLFWELVNRILNANIGRDTKKNCSDVLTRHNDVSSRLSVAVKSGKRST